MFRRILFFFAIAIVPVSGHAATVTYSFREDDISTFVFAELPGFDGTLGILNSASVDIGAEYLVESGYSGATTERTQTRTSLSAEIFEGTIAIGFDFEEDVPYTIGADEVECSYPSADCSGTLSATAQYRFQNVFTSPDILSSLSSNTIEVYFLFSDEVFVSDDGPEFVGPFSRSGVVTGSVTYDFQPAAVPLPPSLPLMAGGCVGLGLVLRRRRRA